MSKTYLTTVTLYLENGLGEEVCMEYDCEVVDHGEMYCDADGNSFGPKEFELVSATDKEGMSVDKDSPLWKKIEDDVEIGLDAQEAYFDDQIGERY